MQSSRTASTKNRWLAGLLVAAAVITVLGLKLADTRPAYTALPTAERSAAATVPALGSEPASTTIQPTKLQPQSDPFPGGPAAQVEWVLRNRKPAMVLFHSTNCRACIMMMEVVKTVRAEYEPAIVFIDVITNDQSNSDLVRQAQIRAIPTSFFITSSGQGKGFIGAMKQEDLRSELASLMPTE